MVRRLTHEQFMERFMVKNPNAENIEVLGKYVNNKTKILCKCKIDNYEWEVRADHLLEIQGCPICVNNNKKLTYEQFIERLNEINPNIKILSKYINTQTKVECECEICNHKWNVSPTHLLYSQSGCPMCFENRRGDIRQKTHEQFIKELSEINPNIEVLGKYINNRTPIKCGCKIDGYEWSQRPNQLLRYVGCPKCNSSKGEKRIAKYLKECNIENIEQYRFNDCKFKQTLPFDFYIPSLNIAIEFDGKDHYEIFIRSNNETYEEAMDRFIDRKIRDTIKTIYCKENNIKLIRIPYWEFDNIENILDKIFLK